MTMPQKSTPAYAGARFNATGHCLIHRSVRLCAPIAGSSGRYRILRKTCPKCGTAALMTDVHSHKTAVHGYKRRAIRDREVRGHLTTAGGDDHRHHRHDRDSMSKTREPTSPRSGRRARTLSPRRSRSSIQRSPAKTPLSASHVVQRKPSIDKIRRLAGDPTSMIRPPPFSRSSSGDSDEDAKHPSYGKKGSGETSVEGVGHCRVHPEVKLAIRRTARDDGKWDIAKDGCPLCLRSGGRSRSRSTKGSSRGKSISKSIVASIRNAASEDSGDGGAARPRPEASPEDYFSRALVVYDPNAANHNGANSETKTGRPPSGSSVRNRSTILPNSTARMARIAKRRDGGALGRSGGSPTRQSLRRREAETLPVC